MIYFQSLLNGLRLIILTDHKLLTTFIADSFFLWRNVYNMIGCTAGAYSSTAHTINDHLICKIDLDCIINLLTGSCQSLCQRLSLRDGSWESIEYITVLCIVLVDSVYNKITGKLIRNKLSGII